MTPKTHHRLERAAVVGIFAIAIAVTFFVVIGIATASGYVPQ